MLLQLEPALGAPVSAVARGFHDLMTWQALSHQVLIRDLEGATPPSALRLGMDSRQSQILSFLFTLKGAALEASLLFDTNRLLEVMYPGSPEDLRKSLEAFLRLASRSVAELRALLATAPEFSMGHVGGRLSPLERFPVVRVNPAGQEPAYVVPNVRHLAKSFTPVVDFTLLEQLGPSYEQARGALLHLYLWELVEARLPRMVVIPETSYRVGKQRKDGPDLTLLDQGAGRLVAVEVKGRGLNLATRLTMDPAQLADNLKDAFKALLALPAKIGELYSNLPEYAPWTGAVRSTRASPPVLVVVLREGAHVLSHLLREEAKMPGHPLHAFPHRYTILAADTFERAVEVAHRSGLPLAEVLEAHWQRTATRDYSEPDADSFGGVEIPEEETFAAGFIGYNRQGPDP